MLKIKLNNELNNIAILYFIGLLYGVFLIGYREIYNVNILLKDKKYFLNCNGWCISHFIHYIFLGFFAPSYWWLLIIIGFLFEIYEYFLSKYTKNVKCKLVEDTITNTIGIFVGIAIRKLFFNKKIIIL